MSLHSFLQFSNLFQFTSSFHLSLFLPSFLYLYIGPFFRLSRYLTPLHVSVACCNISRFSAGTLWAVCVCHPVTYSRPRVQVVKKPLELLMHDNKTRSMKWSDTPSGITAVPFFSSPLSLLSLFLSLSLSLSLFLSLFSSLARSLAL
jgi:hypothetical protein